ncbi:clamp loader of DNA polymerase [Tenacibaculum phage PTm1]|uniref:Clamp loader, small subunit n=2 Tax=Shirahamavirus PTm1 TaxID=2846435 RepID=A0A5S9EQN1_9CAUD|nr:clamp loader of DNA polymerase [Tenacibaculum phage PTm1]BBI90664.1 clamp loader, small subunit [Tenacibaculum phage PTm1]BBI90969.1 clamp loader, small subunit [Tenacibaculum phage PTm5]
MSTKSLREISWVQKYRPTELKHIILPQRLRKEFKDGEIGSHQLFSGTSGLGKTTLAKILAKGRSTLFIEAGVNTGIGEIRDQIIPFASTTSLVNSAKKKVVIIDEASELSKQAQKALKSVIEKYEKNVFFILTANHPENLDPNMMSRLTHVKFNFTQEESREQLMQYVKRVRHILNVEGNWTIEQKALQAIFKNCYPDLRNILNVLYGVTKSIEKGTEITSEHIKDLTVSKDEELFKFLVSEFDPHKIYKFVKENYNGKELQAIQALHTPFLEYLNRNKLSHKVLGCAVVSQKYGFEARTGSIDLMITLLALCSTLSNLFKS